MYQFWDQSLRMRYLFPAPSCLLIFFADLDNTWYWHGCLLFVMFFGWFSGLQWPAGVSSPLTTYAGSQLSSSQCSGSVQSWWVCIWFTFGQPSTWTQPSGQNGGRSGESVAWSAGGRTSQALPTLRGSRGQFFFWPPRICGSECFNFARLLLSMLYWPGWHLVLEQFLLFHNLPDLGLSPTITHLRHIL